MIGDWNESEKLTDSDHQFILFELANLEIVRPAARLVNWNDKMENMDRVVATLQEDVENICCSQ